MQLSPPEKDGRYPRNTPMRQWRIIALPCCLLLLAMGCGTSATRLPQTESRSASLDDSNSGRSIADRVARARTALHDTEMKFGAEAPQTLEAVDQLAAALEMEGDYAGAAAFYDRAVKRRLKLLGPRDTRTTASIARLAAAYLAAGSYEKAEPLFYRVLDVTEVAAPNGEQTAEVLNNLGVLYSMMGEYARAREFYLKALAIFEKTKGPEDGRTLSTVDNLGILYQLDRQYSEAENHFKRVWEIRKKTLGLTNELTVAAMDNLGCLYTATKQFDRARPLLESALALKQILYGTNA